MQWTDQIAAVLDMKATKMQIMWNGHKSTFLLLLAAGNDMHPWCIIFRMYDFRRPVLVINDPDILKNVLVKNFSNFYNRRVRCFLLLLSSLSAENEKM